MKLFVCFEEMYSEVHGTLDWHKMYRIRENSIVIKAIEDKTVVGQLVIETNSYLKMAEFYFFVVRSDYQEQGIGTKILKKAEKYLKENGFKIIRLDVQLENEEKLIPWYEKNGYKIVQKYHGDYEPGEEKTMDKYL